MNTEKSIIYITLGTIGALSINIIADAYVQVHKPQAGAPIVEDGAPATTNEITKDAIDLYALHGVCPDDAYYKNATDWKKSPGVRLTHLFTDSDDCAFPLVVYTNER